MHKKKTPFATKPHESISKEAAERELAVLLDQIEERREKFAIADADLTVIPKQKEMVGDFIRFSKMPWGEDRPRFFLYYGWNGAGKCWDPKEPMLMSDGSWKEAGSLEVGDKLMGPDSTPRTVTSTYWWESRMYRITPESGEPIVVNGNHQLMLLGGTHTETLAHLEGWVYDTAMNQVGVEDYVAYLAGGGKPLSMTTSAVSWEPPKLLGFTVEPIGPGTYVGFTLDGDKLHLDRNFAVHHNTFVGSYVTKVKALGSTWRQYGLPDMGHSKCVWVMTKSGSNVKTTIEPYLLGKGGIPERDVLSTKRDNGILKEVRLVNQTVIYVLTYDQGRENVQGGNPDFIWLDEEPKDEEIFQEIKARTRTLECELLITMTPLSGLTPIYEYFLNHDNEALRRKQKVYVVSSETNPFQSKDWMLGMTDEEYRLRVLGSFENPTGLVYNEFHRARNVVDVDDDSFLDSMTHYRSVDFGVEHPTGVVFIARDEDGNVLVYDEIKKSGATIGEISELIKKASGKREFALSLRDSASKREGLEMEQYGIRLTPADKHSKGAGGMSNRRAGIMRINQMLKSRKLMVSSKCQELIKEFERHYYKEGGKKDGEVVKLDDDLLDALRYAIFFVDKYERKTDRRTALEKKLDSEERKRKSWGRLWL